MYKFRTMVYNADTRLDEVRIHNEIRGPVFKSSDVRGGLGSDGFSDASASTNFPSS